VAWLTGYGWNHLTITCFIVQQLNVAAQHGNHTLWKI